MFICLLRFQTKKKQKDTFLLPNKISHKLYFNNEKAPPQYPNQESAFVSLLVTGYWLLGLVTK